MKTNLQFLRLMVLTLFALVSFQMSAQISMLPPVPAGGSSGFTKICAGIDSGFGPFNSYDVTIAWGGTANSDNEFVLEISDANGDFTNPIELGRVGDQNSANPKSFDLNFSIPTDLFVREAQVLQIKLNRRSHILFTIWMLQTTLTLANWGTVTHQEISVIQFLLIFKSTTSSTQKSIGTNGSEVELYYLRKQTTPLQ